MNMGTKCFKIGAWTLNLNFMRGLWMILKGNFIQKEDARKATVGINVFLMKIFLAMTLNLFQYERMIVHKNILKSIMN